MRIRMEGEEQVTGSQESTGAEDVQGTRFELDLEAPDTSNETETQQTSTEAPHAPTHVDVPTVEQQLLQMQQDNLRLTRESHELRGAITPFLESYQRQLQQQQQPAKTLEQIQADPNSTPKDLVDYINWQNDQRQMQIQAATELAARRATSENLWRGRLSDRELGKGNDFDSIRMRYVDPSIHQNPHVRTAIHMASPEDPALGEFVFGVVQKIVEEAKGDPVNTFRRLLGDKNAFSQGANDMRKKITQAARTGADRVLSGNRPTSEHSRKIGAGEIWDLSDAEFNALDNQLTGGM